MDQSVSAELFVEILNKYLYYFDQQNEAVSQALRKLKRSGTDNDSKVTVKYLNGLIELIHSNLASNQDAATSEQPKLHFYRTLEMINSREYEGVITAASKK
jgi:vacuolar protein sorting-associated protein 35